MDQSQAGRVLRSFCIAASIFLFGYFCLLTFNSVAGFPTTNNTRAHWPWLADKPLGEDGFYMLAVAQTFASTHHLVYTYDMPATGIQPLATIAFAAVVALVQQFNPDDKWVPIRAMLFFNSVLFLIFTWLMARFAASIAPPGRHRIVFWLAFMITLLDYSIFRLFTYGLETGFYLCFLLLTMMSWRKIVVKDQADWSGMIVLGIAAGFAGLSRIDFGLLFAVLLAYLLIRRMASILQILTSGLIALVITSPWFFFVHKVSGSWLPSSGKAESKLITIHNFDRLDAVFKSLLSHLVPWSFAAVSTKPTTIVGVLSLPLLYLLLKRATETRAGFNNEARYRPLFVPWVFGLAVLTCTYVIFFWSTVFYGRYLSPLVIVTIPLLALALAEESWVTRRPRTLAAILTILFLAWTTSSLHLGHVGNPHVLSAKYIHEVFPYARVGAFQSGVIGYFNPNVENLDGKLNLGALEATIHHTMPAFIDSEKINILVDWEGYLSSLPPDYLSNEWQICPQPMPKDDASLCYIRKSYLATLGPQTP